MDNVLIIERPDLVALAAELAELRHQSVQDALSGALQAAVQQERERGLARAARRQKAETLLAEVHALLPNPRPSSNHDWLYDENGLPI